MGGNIVARISTEVTQELLANVSGVSKACQLRGWIYLAARFPLPVIYFLEELGAAAQPGAATFGLLKLVQCVWLLLLILQGWKGGF